MGCSMWVGGKQLFLFVGGGFEGVEHVYGQGKAGMVEQQYAYRFGV